MRPAFAAGTDNSEAAATIGMKNFRRRIPRSPFSAVRTDLTLVSAGVRTITLQGYGVPSIEGYG